jgi:hypothetical protein
LRQQSADVAMLVSSLSCEAILTRRVLSGTFRRSRSLGLDLGKALPGSL